jgi:small subunit ribosomal protein S9
VTETTPEAPAADAPAPPAEAEPTAPAAPAEPAAPAAPAEAAEPAAPAEPVAPAQPRADDASYTTQTVDKAPRREAVTAPGAATGRRKEAIARVRIVPGTGQWLINGRSLGDYFPNKVHQQIVSEPFETLDQAGSYDVVARVHGGGVSGQAGALRLGLARALTEADPDSRGSLKKVGFLTRDARVKERKKYGLKKARKAPQYSKR